MYAYTKHDPVNNLDPLGMIEVDIKVKPHWGYLTKPGEILINGESVSGVRSSTSINENDVNITESW
jgi:hypothetical protein